MPNFHRYYIPNSIVFITSVTFNRSPYLKTKIDIDLFWETLKKVKEIHSFSLFAYVILLDHFHFLMQMKGEGENFSQILHSIKRNYTLNYEKTHKITTHLKLWQSRFWDHVIRNEHDLTMHFDYIHWNPVKHGLVDLPEAWPHSSFLFWYDHGCIPTGWGHNGQPSSIVGMNIE